MCKITLIEFTTLLIYATIYYIFAKTFYHLKMAKNNPTGDNARKGAVKDRSQVQNPKTGLYVKRDTQTGRFMDVKTTGGKFKGVRKEK